MSKQAGRKPLDPSERNSEILNVRVRPDVRRALERIANQRGLTLSRHVQRALDQYIERSKRAPHVDEFSTKVADLTEKVERNTGEQWTQDPFTAEAVSEGLAQLFRAFVTDETNIKEFIPPKLAKEFQGKRVTPKLIGRREAMAVLREA